MEVLKSRLYQMELERQEQELGSERRNKIGTGDRSEKIRTYNYPQNRVTDHRIGFTLNTLDRVMQGDIDKVIEADKLFPAESYYATKNLGTTLATVGAGIISSNIITPIVRNSMASNVQKNYIARKKAVGDNKKVLDETNATKQPTFKSNPYYNYSSSYGLKI